MIRCLALSKRDAENWQKTHPPVAGDPLSNLHTSGNARYSDEDTVALVALDDQTLVGKVVVRYSDVLVNNTWLRCLIPGDLFVAEAYRSKAVGMMLLLNLLKTRRPMIASGVSAAAAQIYDRLPQFHRVDAAPMHLLGLNFAGSVRVGRLAAQRAVESHGTQGRFRTLASIAAHMGASARARHRRVTGFEVLGPDKAVQWLDGIAGVTSFPIQLPWNRSVLTQSIRGKVPNHRTWVVRDGADACWLMDMYARPERVSLLRSNDSREVLVATLTEVFPPVTSADLARFVISHAAQNAVAMGATLLFVCAPTPEFAEACQSSGLPHMADKSVYVCPNGLDDATARVLKDPSKWWCRARSEEQFSESYIGSAIAQPTPLI